MQCLNILRCFVFTRWAVKNAAWKLWYGGGWYIPSTHVEYSSQTPFTQPGDTIEIKCYTMMVQQWILHIYRCKYCIDSACKFQCGVENWGYWVFSESVCVESRLRGNYLQISIIIYIFLNVNHIYNKTVILYIDFDVESRKHFYIYLPLYLLLMKKAVIGINSSKLFSKPAGSVTLHLNKGSQGWPWHRAKQENYR